MFTSHRDVKQGLQLLPPLILYTQTGRATHNRLQPSQDCLVFVSCTPGKKKCPWLVLESFLISAPRERLAWVDTWAERGLIRTHKIPTYLGRTERKISNLELMLLVKYEEFLPEKWERPEWITRLPYSREIPSTRTLDTLGPKKDIVWETFIVQWERSILWNLGLKNNQQVKLERVWPLIHSWIVHLS